jgi:hypothetical protein
VKGANRDSLRNPDEAGVLLTGAETAKVADYPRRLVRSATRLGEKELEILASLPVTKRPSPPRVRLRYPSL